MSQAVGRFWQSCNAIDMARHQASFEQLLQFGVVNGKIGQLLLQMLDEWARGGWVAVAVIKLAHRIQNYKMLIGQRDLQIVRQNLRKLGRPVVMILQMPIVIKRY